MGAFPLLLTLAWRNLWRHRGRTAAILFALALGVWSMVCLAALTRGSMEQQLDKAIANLTGHVQIHAPGYRDDPVIERSMETPTDAIVSALTGSHVTAWSVRVRVPAVVSSERESAGITIVGIDPAREKGLSFIAAAVKEGRYLESPEEGGVLLGRELAERLETGVGRRVVLMSQDANNAVADRGFRVVGIFDAEPQSIETSYVFAGSATIQQMLRLGDRVSEIAVMTDDRAGADLLAARLRETAPTLDVQPWTVLEPLLVLTEQVTNVILLIWYAIVFTAMSFGLINTLLMAVFERTREFGLFQALGMPPRQILGQVLLESLMLLGISLAVGNLAAGATLRALRDGIDLSAFAEGLEMVGVSPVLYPAITANDVAMANLLVFVLGLLASLYPAWRAARHVPVVAINRTYRMEPTVVCRNVSKVYRQNSLEVHALADVTLEIPKQGLVCLSGPSGSGKTTLLNVVGGLDRPSSGEIYVAGSRIDNMESGELAKLRLHRIGFVFQAYNLIPVLTARENVEFVMQLQGVAAATRREKAMEILKEVGLDGLENRRPAELSGGQQQRVAVARAIVSEPALVLADEPTANLDSKTAENLMQLLVHMNQEHGVTFIFSTHDRLVMDFSRRLITLRDGRIVDDQIRN